MDMHYNYNNNPEYYWNHQSLSPYRYYRQPQAVKTPPNVSYYVHLKDAPQEQWPAFVTDYRRKFNAKFAEQRRQRAKEIRIQFLKERVERLSRRLAQVATMGMEYHAKRNHDWLATRDHLVEDMRQHLQRYQRRQSERVANLRAHNGQVQKRCELLRYRSYLTHIARQHDQKRQRRGIF